MSKRTQRAQSKFHEGFEHAKFGGSRDTIPLLGKSAMAGWYAGKKARPNGVEVKPQYVGMSPLGLRHHFGLPIPVGVSVFQRMWREDIEKHYPGIKL